MVYFSYLGVLLSWVGFGCVTFVLCFITGVCVIYVFGFGLVRFV